MNQRHRLGQLGEAIAARYLEEVGFNVTDRNVASRMGELDLVALDGDETVFVEVKTRVGQSDLAPDGGVTPAKLARLERLGELYLLQAGTPDANWRVDVIAIVLDHSGQVLSLDHLRGAYD
jgi:putative endonuclease